MAEQSGPYRVEAWKHGATGQKWHRVVGPRGVVAKMCDRSEDVCKVRAVELNLAAGNGVRQKPPEPRPAPRNQIISEGSQRVVGEGNP